MYDPTHDYSIPAQPGPPAEAPTDLDELLGALRRPSPAAPGVLPGGFGDFTRPTERPGEHVMTGVFALDVKPFLILHPSTRAFMLVTQIKDWPRLRIIAWALRHLAAGHKEDGIVSEGCAEILLTLPNIASPAEADALLSRQPCPFIAAAPEVLLTLADLVTQDALLLAEHLEFFCEPPDNTNATRGQ